MRLSTLAALLIVTTVLLSGCSQTSMAALDDRSHDYYGRAAQAAFMAAPTHQAAQVDAITASDMPAPTPARPAAFTQPSPKPVVHNGSGAWVWPVQGKVIGSYGQHGAGVENTGMSIAASAGTPVRAVAAGNVAYVGEDVPNFGTMVIVRHQDGAFSSYAHLAQAQVRQGQSVAQGASLGTVGTTGGVGQPQLHFAVREGDQTIDPMRRLPSQWAMR